MSFHYEQQCLATHTAIYSHSPPLEPHAPLLRCQEIFAPPLEARSQQESDSQQVGLKSTDSKKVDMEGLDRCMFHTAIHQSVTHRDISISTSIYLIYFIYHILKLVTLVR